ncbi:uncharacterized protein TNCV_1367831 [Trichonephila clavipes]|nr:uncharacterized protein TNCV_1367831 [Trichonephila clavipes]
MDLVILKHGQMTRAKPELAPPLLTTTPHQREDISALDRFNVHRCPTRRVFCSTGSRHANHDSIPGTPATGKISASSISNYDYILSPFFIPHPSERNAINIVQFSDKSTEDFPVICYTDGSKIDGSVGFAFVVFRSGVESENLQFRIQIKSNPLCRKCGYMRKTVPYVLNHCKVHSTAWKTRHDSEQNLVAKSIPAHLGTLTTNKEYPGIMPSLIPDLVLRRSGGETVVDFNVAFDDRYEPLEACNAKIQKYQPIHESLRAADASRRYFRRLLGSRERYRSLTSRDLSKI